MITVALAALLLASPGAAAGRPGTPPQDPALRARILGAASRIFRAARYCTLATSGRDGQPEVRIIDPIEPSGPGFEVYFATNPRSRKVAQLRRDPRASLLCFDAAGKASVSLAGRVARVSGKEQALHYKEEWKGFFDRDKPQSYALYRLSPTRVEVVSPRDGLSGDPATWAPDAVRLR